MIVQSVIDLGHNLGITLVAEGVETEQSLTTLAGLGCDVAQGYHICRPIPAAAFDIWRAERSFTADPANNTPRAPSLIRTEVADGGHSTQCLPNGGVRGAA